MTASWDRALGEGLRGSFERKREVRENLTLLVDTVHQLTGSPCSAFLVSRLSGQVWWDYHKGSGFMGGTLAARQPYQVCLGEPSEGGGWEAGEVHYKLVSELDGDSLMMLRIKRLDEEGGMEPVMDLVEEALPVIRGLHAAERERAAVCAREFVRRMCDTLLALKDRERALQLLAAAVSKALSSERAAVLGISRDGKTFALKAVYGKVRGPAGKSRPIRLQDGLAGWSLAHRLTVNVADARRDPRFIVTTRDDIVSLLVAPVCPEGKPLGAICAVNKRCSEFDGIKPFPSDDEELLVEVSRRTGGILSP